MPSSRAVLILGITAVLGCTVSSPPAMDAESIVDQGVDATPDAAHVDAGGQSLDAQLTDARLLDARLLDARLTDARLTDARLTDARLFDARLLDARPFDAAEPDARQTDAHASAPDAYPADAHPADAQPMDAAVAPCNVNCGALNPADVVEHRATALESCAFRLRRTGDPAVARGIARDLADLARGRVDFTAVDLNRVAENGITPGAADRLRNHPFEGFRWNAGDMATTDWYPQGMTGISDAHADAAAPARRLFVVSWYDHRDVRPTKGVRITLADFTDPANVGYRHLLLVVPERVDGRATFSAVTIANGGPLHAGGIVWIGDLLYVADTTEGFRVFDLAQVIEVSNFDDRDRIGAANDRVDAHGYRYVVPQIARYQLAPDACPARFSFAGLDRSVDPPLLVSGEYRRDDAGGRVVRWPVGADGWLQASGGQVIAHDALIGGQTRMQGGLTWQGDVYLSSSSQAGRLGRLYRTRTGRDESSISAWVYGCEDLYFERHTDRIWTAAEHPRARDVVSIRRLAP